MISWWWLIPTAVLSAAGGAYLTVRFFVSQEQARSMR